MINKKEIRNNKKACINKEKNICAYCGQALNNYNKVTNFKIPLSRNGTNKLSNLVVCCKQCAETKNLMTQEEFNMFRHVTSTLSNIKQVYLVRKFIIANIRLYNNINWEIVKYLICNLNGKPIHIKNNKIVSLPLKSIRITKLIQNNLTQLRNSKKYFKYVANRKNQKDSIKIYKNFLVSGLKEYLYCFEKNKMDNVRAIKITSLENLTNIEKLFCKLAEKENKK